MEALASLAPPCFDLAPATATSNPAVPNHTTPRRRSRVEKVPALGIQRTPLGAVSSPTSSSAIVRLTKAIDEADLGRLDLEWLARAGAPSDFCERLKAFLTPGVSERELVLALLHALVSEAPDNRIPKAATRRIRRAWADFGNPSAERRPDLQEAVRAVAAIESWWTSVVVE
jgi:hypothetical protein